MKFDVPNRVHVTLKTIFYESARAGSRQSLASTCNQLDPAGTRRHCFKFTPHLNYQLKCLLLRRDKPSPRSPHELRVRLGGRVLSRFAPHRIPADCQWGQTPRFPIDIQVCVQPGIPTFIFKVSLQFYPPNIRGQSV